MQALVDGALLSLIWLVQLVLYPSMRRIDATAFKAWHARYTTTMGFIVMPLMFGQVAIEMFRLSGGDLNITRLLLIAAAWLSTFVLSVPLHRRLQRDGKSAATIDRLVLTNWPRTACWTLLPFT